MAGTPRSGSGFINFSDFVGANQGAINRTRGAMLDPINKKTAGAAAQGELGLDTLGRNIGGSTLTYNPQDVEETLLQKGAMGYTGPNTAQDDANFAQAFGDASGAKKDSSRMLNPYGRAGALRDQFGAGSPTYGAGQQLFDSALLGAGAGKGAYEQTAKTAGHLFDKFQKDAGTIDASIAAAKTSTTAAAAQNRTQGEQLHADKVKREADAAKSKAEAEAYQRNLGLSGWVKPKPGQRIPIYNPGGPMGGQTGP